MHMKPDMNHFVTVAHTCSLFYSMRKEWSKHCNVKVFHCLWPSIKGRDKRGPIFVRYIFTALPTKIWYLGSQPTTMVCARMCIKSGRLCTIISADIVRSNLEGEPVETVGNNRGQPFVVGCDPKFQICRGLWNRTYFRTSSNGAKRDCKIDLRFLFKFKPKPPEPPQVHHWFCIPPDRVFDHSLWL